MKNIEQIFESRKDDAQWNTSYPLSPDQWLAYRTCQPLDFKEVRQLAFYVHIPFCKRLCSFCEYTKTACADAAVHGKYLDVVRGDIHRLISCNPDIQLNGFDIGGGTPTALDERNFYKLMDIYKDTVGRVRQTPDFEPSIEATFETLSEDKALAITDAGIRRVSLGMQSADTTVLAQNNRSNGNAGMMANTIDMLHRCGVEKVNIDLMYGLLGQTVDTLQSDMAMIDILRPEQVTLYELRTNMIAEHAHMDKDMLFSCYKALFGMLRQRGYHARFGQNTFSKDAADEGLSSYLRHRMLGGLPYKGFGISAQSMNGHGLAYNVGKNDRAIRHVITASDTFGEEYSYALPPTEVVAKLIAISGYGGRINKWRVSELLPLGGWDEYYGRQERFCLDNGLMENDTEGFLCITEKGFRHYGAVFSLFYSLV